MADLFFYGTLCHLPLLRAVLGREEVATCDARLADHRAAWVAGESFPMLHPAPGESAPGLLARDLSEEDVARLCFYEGGFHLDPAPVTVETGTGAVGAAVFRADPGAQPGAPWSLPAWEDRWAAIALAAAREIMAWYGRRPAAEMAARFTPIAIRANARVAAAQRPADPVRDLSRDVIVQEHKRPYMNFFAVEEMDLQYRRHDGGMSPVVNRGALMVGEASVVLPYDPLRDRVLLVEQFRAPVYMAGDPDPWVWEPVAGLVDPGETPEEAARREAEEEAGLTLRWLERAGGVYSSTGCSAEFLNLFIGVTDLPDIPEGGGGVAGEGEDLRSRLLSYEELMQGVDAGMYRDMPLVTTALWLSRHRDRLRADV